MTEELDVLAKKIRQCRLCRDAPTGRPLPHEPRPIFQESATARILIASQAPGLRAHESGITFNDRSGDRLREWLGVSREEFYDPDNFAIAPMGFCFPGNDAKGGDLPPRKECALQWRNALMNAMPQLDFVLTIGQYAQVWHMKSGHVPAQWRGNLTDTVSDWRRSFFANTKPRVFPLPHPSWRNTHWLKKNPWFEAEALPVLRVEIRARIG